MRARLHHLVIDCPAPRELARFSSALLDQPITHDSGEGVALGATRPDGSDSDVFADPAGHPCCLIARPARAGDQAPRG